VDARHKAGHDEFAGEPSSIGRILSQTLRAAFTILHLPFKRKPYLDFSSVIVKAWTNEKSSGWVSSGVRRRALECGLGLPKRNGTRQRSRTRPNGMPVIAALHDPLTVLVADDLAHVVTPDHDGSD